MVVIKPRADSSDDARWDSIVFLLYYLRDDDGHIENAQRKPCKGNSMIRTSSSVFCLAEEPEKEKMNYFTQKNG